MSFEQRSGIQEGSWVQHRVSGWAGVVTRATPVDQRVMVTVKPTRPRPLEVWDKESGEFVPTPEDWDGWRPITVYADELVEWRRGRGEAPRKTEGRAPPRPSNPFTTPPGDPMPNPNIAFVGKAGSGKSTAAQLLQQIDPDYERVSFAGPLKHVAVGLWDRGAETDRDKLQRLGVAVREIDPDTWVRLWSQRLAGKAWPIVTDDLRFENEWWAAKGAGFVLVRIEASKGCRIERLRANGKLQDEAQLDHESETAVDHLGADYCILNHGTKLGLADELVAILDREAKRR